MTLTDAMIFAPDLGPRQQASAPVRAREERRLAAAKKRGGSLQRLRRLRQARRLRRRGRAARSGRRALGVARQGAGALARGAATRAGVGAAVANPVGLLITALVVAGTVALRLGTGTPLEGLGESLNSAILGDVDDEARAKMTVRRRFQSDDALSYIAGEAGRNKPNPQLARLSDDLIKIEKRFEIGASLLRKEFPANNIVDMLILRAQEAVLGAWNAVGGKQKAEEAMRRIGSHANADTKAGGR